MSNSMVATAFYVLVATTILLCLHALRTRAQRRRRASSLRAFIQAGAVLAAQGQRQRQRRRKVRVVSGFATGEEDGVSSCPWPDGGARNCSGQVACLLDDAVTTPFRPLPQTPVAPVVQPESLTHLTAAHALRVIAGADRDAGNITLAEAVSHA